LASTAIWKYRRWSAHPAIHGFLAKQSIRLDRFRDRLERVERRLDITDG
jgi:hypothetical protein